MRKQISISLVSNLLGSNIITHDLGSSVLNSDDLSFSDEFCSVVVSDRFRSESNDVL